jgi:hypothetical protein
MELSFTNFTSKLGSILSRFHIIIFTITVIGGLIICMLLINATITQSDSSGAYTPASTNTNFDQQTINRIKQLHSSSDPTPAPSLDLSGRINPFVD